jgi:hypothetical protein
MHEGGCVCGAVRYRVKQHRVPIPPDIEEHDKSAIK